MQQNQTQPAPLALVITAFAIVYIVWGSTYFFIQASEKGFPPFLLGMLRFSASGIILLGWCAFRKKQLFLKKQLIQSFITGNLLLFIANGSIIWTEQFLPSSFVAVLVSAAPLWFVLLDGRNRKANFSNKKIIIGVITGFAGVVLLFAQKINASVYGTGNIIQIVSLIILVIGNICWSAGSLYSKYHSDEGDTMVGAAWQMLAAAFSYLVVIPFSNELKHFNWQHVPLNAWLSVLYLVTMGSLAGYSAYIWLLKVRPATQVSTNAYVNPVVAVLLGVLFGGEIISNIQFIALVIILSSVFIINADKYRRKQIVS